ncbi:MAG TPA: class I SAM-dependent methyltransferase [Terriglobales bacterium]|nr:class I SAM-dependent methyltransferase [Terriglobales bacterium]
MSQPIAEKRAIDIAKVDHWETVWKQASSIRQVSSFDYYDVRMAKLFRSLLKQGSRVIEIGCGGSRWMHFFNTDRKCETWGIDYSPEGLAITEKDNRDGPRVRLIAGDFFDQSSLPFDYFDLVFSGGFIEHFTDPSLVTRRMAEILRPGGRALTTTPNFTGIYKNVQRWIDQDIYEKHVPMNQEAMDRAHIDANLLPILPAQFYGCFAPGVVNYGTKSFLLAPIKVIQQTVCWSLKALHLDWESQALSPHILGLYQKPQQG